MSDEPSGPGRREARERVLGLLYEAEAKATTAAGLLDALPLRPDAYAVAAVEGIAATGDMLDELIAEHAIGWKLDRLPQVDRAILRLAAWELRARPEVPTAVVINEAVELAKEYSTEKSPSFVNGVLDSIAAEVRA